MLQQVLFARAYLRSLNSRNGYCLAEYIARKTMNRLQRDAYKKRMIKNTQRHKDATLFKTHKLSVYQFQLIISLCSTIIMSTIPLFLNEHFANIARQENVTTFTVSISASGANQGAGFMSDLLHINLTGKRCECDITLPLVVKLLPANESRQAEFSSALIFEREIQFYAKVLPLLQRFQSEKNVETEFNGLPHVYVAIADRASKEFVLIMRDLRPEGYAMLPKGQLAEYAHVKSVLEQLGRMHGLSMALRDQRPDDFAEILQLDDVLFKMLESKVFRGLFDASFVQAIEKLQAPDDIETMKMIQRNWYEDLWQTMRADAAGRFGTVLHGDCWSNNIMFANDGVRV